VIKDQHPYIPFNDGDMWLFYRDSRGGIHTQHWLDLQQVGPLIEPDSGDDMELVGWGTCT